MVEKIKNIKNFGTYLYIGLFLVSLISLLVSGNLLNKAKNNVVESKVRIAELDTDLQNLDKLVDDNENNAQEVQVMESSLPSTYEDVAYFARTMDVLSQTQNENIELEIDEEKVGEGSYSSLVFSVKTQGDYVSLKNTLSILSQLPYHTKVDSLTVSSVDGRLETLTNFRLLMR
jgi:hypothetical protein